MMLLGKLAIRYMLVWIADAVSIGVTALVLPGIYFIKESQFWYLNPFVVALWLALLNVLVRPVFMVLLLPVNIVTFGLASLVLNSGLFYLIRLLVPSFVIANFPAALIGLLVLSTVNTLLANFFLLEEDYSLFYKVMDKLSTMTKPREINIHDRGLIVLQVDGLSYSALKMAVNRGKMPFIGDMLARHRYTLKKWFTGLPSQTSSVQAGIFYGDNFNIPGFRWYDKKRKKELVSSNSSDMNEIDERFGSNHETLLKDGTCINTLIHGGAKKKLITLSVILEKDLRRRKGELEDLAIFSLHPYLYNRAIVLLIWDFITDRIQSLLDVLTKKSPRTRRNIVSSFLRAIGNAFLRESTTYFIMEDIVRGIPVIYANYIGYDIISHHAGPYSWDAISAMTGIDRHIKKIQRTVKKKSARPYDMIILSDHGQSKCTSFEFEYGKSLAEFIKESLHAPLLKSKGYSEGQAYLATLLNEMRLVEEAYGTQPIRRSRRTLEKIGTKMWVEPEEDGAQEGIVVCCTGNLGHVYFTEYPEKLTIEKLLGIHPAVVEALASHPGIGCIIIKNEMEDFLMIAEKGMRHLISGNIEGLDPLLPYNGDGRVIKSLINLCEYPNSGDVIVLGAVRDDGIVVSFEDQVGTHGGLGGKQTEAFVMYPKRPGIEEEIIESPVDMHYFLKGFSNSAVAGKEQA